MSRFFPDPDCDAIAVGARPTRPLRTNWLDARLNCASNHSWLASSGASVVIHSHVKTEHQRAPFPRTPRRGNGDQSDAQQVRAARQPHRLRLTRARFGRPSRPLPRALIAPCLKQGMDHGCLPCAIQSFAKALLSLAQQRELARSRRARRSAC